MGGVSRLAWVVFVAACGAHVTPRPPPAAPSHVQAAEWYRSGHRAVLGANRAGVRDGLWIEWYESGSPRQAEAFVAGERQGAALYWHEDGKEAARGMFDRGLSHGAWV